MSAKDKNRISIDIYGINYTLTGYSSISHMKTIATHVNEQMNKISKGNPRLDTPRLAVLAAVNMADDLFKLQVEMDQIQGDRNKLEKVIAEYNQLQEQYNELMKKFDSQIEWNTEQDANDGELRKKHEELQQEVATLKQANLELSAELLRQQEQRQTELAEQSAKSDLQGESALQEDYRKLQEEYKKLQNEYNEWIELADGHPSGET